MNNNYKENLINDLEKDNCDCDKISRSIIDEQMDRIKKRDDAINANIEDIMIDLHNNCEFMGSKLASIAELIKLTSDEAIKASTNN